MSGAASSPRASSVRGTSAMRATTSFFVFSHGPQAVVAGKVAVAPTHRLQVGVDEREVVRSSATRSQSR